MSDLGGSIVVLVAAFVVAVFIIDVCTGGKHWRQ
jgi:hypothetical protein